MDDGGKEGAGADSGDGRAAGGSFDKKSALMEKNISARR